MLTVICCSAQGSCSGSRCRCTHRFAHTKLLYGLVYEQEQALELQTGMLLADKENTASLLLQGQTSVKGREIEWYTNCFKGLWVSSSIFLTILYSGLTVTKIPITLENYGQIIYNGITSVGVCLQLWTLINCTMCLILGPRLALLDPTSAALARAVSGFHTVKVRTLNTFWAGLFFLHLNVISWAWIGMGHFAASVVTAMVSLFLVFLLVYFVRLKHKFRPAVKERGSLQPVLDPEMRRPVLSQTLPDTVASPYVRQEN